MRIGIMSGTRSGPDATLEALIAQAKDIEARGFHTMWMAQIMAHDAITVLSLIGRETQRIELGTAVVPSFPRHPMMLAGQCLTAQAACDGRFVLGLGLSHKLVIEGMMGLSYDRPARHMREYMEILGPLVRGEPAAFEGETYRVNTALAVPEASPVPVVIAALGDQMLRIAGRVAEGSILWMTGPKTIEDHIVPKLQKAAADAGRSDPRVVAGLPIALTHDPDAAREKIAKSMALYKQLPSYASMLEKEGANGPEDVAMLGDERELGAQLDRLRDIGVTDLDAAIMRLGEASDARTLEFLESRL